MRAVLASIKPFWAEKIYSGEKDVEVRKTAPSPESGCWDRHLTVYLYESGTGLVTGEFEMSGVEYVATPWFTGNTCLTDVQLKEYGPGRMVPGVDGSICDPIRDPEKVVRLPEDLRQLPVLRELWHVQKQLRRMWECCIGDHSATSELVLCGGTECLRS